MGSPAEMLCTGSIPLQLLLLFSFTCIITSKESPFYMISRTQRNMEKENTMHMGDNKWGLRIQQGEDLSWLNHMALEGLLSMYKQKQGDSASPELSFLRNGSGRRMSITNAMDILRDRLMRAIKRKHSAPSVQGDDWAEFAGEPGLGSIG